MKDPVVQMGDPVLRTKAAAVPTKDITSRAIAAVVSKMKKALAHESYGVAIAAPQIGESLRIFVVAGSVFESDVKPIDATQESPLRRDKHDPNSSAETPASLTEPDRVFINPKITRYSKKTKEMSEGCLSVRGKYGTVMRHERVSLTAKDESGKPVSYNATGLLAHIFQHECDHLDGILYIDKAVKLEEDEEMSGARAKLKAKHNV